MLIETLSDAETWYIRQDAARLIGQFGQADEATIKTLLHGLFDDDNDVRAACVKALVRLARRFPEVSKKIEAKLVNAIEKDASFDKLDKISSRTGHDYAFDGLWMLITGSSLEEYEMLFENPSFYFNRAKYGTA